MIQLDDVSLNFGPQILFDHISLSIPPSKRFGLVGQNGSGKTTLLSMIAGLREASEGRILLPRGWNIAYLPQEIYYLHSKKALLDEVLSVFDHIFDLEKRMRHIEEQLSGKADKELLQEYDHLQERFRRLEGYQSEAKARETLSGLGFMEKDLSRPLSDFSGGWQMRIALAKILLENPDCLLLDEPTNHLDLETLLWLENLLLRFQSTMIIVSHDRYFLDKLVQGIIEVENGKLTLYPGNFTDYEILKEKRLEQEFAKIRNQECMIEHTQHFIDRFRYKASKAKQVQSRIRQLSKITIREPELLKDQIRFRFSVPERSGDPVVAAKDLAFSYPELPLFKNTNFEIRRGEKVALVGPNGVGKSTLMKLIGGNLQASEGSLKIGYNVKIGFFAQEHLEQLNLDNSLLEEVASTAPELPRNEIRSLLGRFLFSGSDVDKKISQLSGGEKSRLLLIKLLLSKANFLMLDEPTNHLDMQSKEILAEALDDFEGTVLIVSHDRFFLDMLVSKIIYFKNAEAKEFLGNFSEYEERILQESIESLVQKAQPKQNERKAQKRREAEERQLRYQREKDLRKEIEKIDKQLSSLEKRREELDRLFVSKGFQDLSISEMQERGREHQALLQELKNLEDIWLELQMKIESFQS